MKEFLEQINCPSVTDVEFVSCVNNIWNILLTVSQISCHLPLVMDQILRILPKNLPNIQKLILTVPLLPIFFTRIKINKEVAKLPEAYIRFREFHCKYHVTTRIVNDKK